MRRWWIPAAAAAAVLLLVGVVWWSGQGDGVDTGAGPGAGTGAGPGAGAAPTGDGSGAAEPGFPGTAEPVDPAPPAEEPPMTEPRGVRIDSYHADDARRLVLGYTTGVPACYGKVREPVVTETPDAVTVTLTRTEPTREGVACIEIALQRSVVVTLDRPLGTRTVRDGSFDGAAVPPGPPPER